MPVRFGPELHWGARGFPPAGEHFEPARTSSESGSGQKVGPLGARHTLNARAGDVNRYSRTTQSGVFLNVRILTHVFRGQSWRFRQGRAPGPPGTRGGFEAIYTFSHFEPGPGILSQGRSRGASTMTGSKKVPDHRVRKRWRALLARITSRSEVYGRSERPRTASRFASKRLWRESRPHAGLAEASR